MNLTALVLVVGDGARRARVVLFVATIDAGDAVGALAHRSAVAVHRGITAAEHDYALVLHIERHVGVIAALQYAVDVGDEKRQGLMDAGQVLAGEVTFHVGVGAHAKTRTEETTSDSSH